VDHSARAQPEAEGFRSRRVGSGFPDRRLKRAERLGLQEPRLTSDFREAAIEQMAALRALAKPVDLEAARRETAII